MMKRYKLKYDLPTFNAGDEFFLSDSGNLVAGTPKEPVTIPMGPVDMNLVAYSRSTLEKFPNILHVWFEEIKEPEYYWFLRDDGIVDSDIVDEDDRKYICRRSHGNTYDSFRAAMRAQDKRDARAVLEATATLSSEKAALNGGWTIRWSIEHNRAETVYSSISFCDEPAWYRTASEAKKSLRENRVHWEVFYEADKKNPKTHCFPELDVV